jgi:hypothetical protein
MLGVVDADTHIAESEGIWEFIDEEMYPRRPVLVSVPDDTLYDASNAFWLIDGDIFPKPSGKGGFRQPNLNLRVAILQLPAGKSPIQKFGSQTWIVWGFKSR